MKIDKTSFYRNSEIINATATSPWGSSIGQSKNRDCRIDFDKAGVLEIIVGMTYKAVSDSENIDISGGSSCREKILCSKFDKVYINNQLLENCSYILCLVKEHSKSHDNRLIVSYANYISYNGILYNKETIDAIQKKLCKTENGAWFIYDLSIANQDELRLSAIVLNETNNVTYQSTDERSETWENLINEHFQNSKTYDDNVLSQLLASDYNNAPENMKVAAIHSFGIQYGNYIKNASEVVRLSGLNPSYSTELSKGINIYKTTRDRIFGLSFANLENTLINISKYRNKSEKRNLEDDFPHQQIFYGAPGTGKSHKVKEVTDTLPPSDVFRTTFHPDSDYSTFVGCYKPKMVKAPIRDGSGHEITSACEDEKKRIAYEYEPQAFLKAYIRAYQTSDPVFLVIEEINRGNCAQVFGDMFQLLDRSENGESDYAIKPETAIQEFLNEKLKVCDISDEAIKSGEEMRLPANLHIWATMNTSDQSLFPIDSAFKRRWAWKYVPIDYDKKKWSIVAKGEKYSWSDFLKEMNNLIASKTDSEDKMLGFFFAKAKDGIIDADTFVDKVVFYLWNDVFKDYGLPKEILNGAESKEFAFRNFFTVDGHANEDMVKRLLDNMKLTKQNVDNVSAEVAGNTSNENA